MPTKQEIHEYLCALRDSGEVNMFLASPYLEYEFGMTRAEAKAALLDWIASFKREKNEAIKQLHH